MINLPKLALTLSIIFILITLIFRGTNSILITLIFRGRSSTIKNPIIVTHIFKLCIIHLNRLLLLLIILFTQHLYHRLLLFNIVIELCDS